MRSQLTMNLEVTMYNLNLKTRHTPMRVEAWLKENEFYKKKNRGHWPIKMLVENKI